jgi:hypothetical protein
VDQNVTASLHSSAVRSFGCTYPEVEFMGHMIFKHFEKPLLCFP